MKRVKKQNKLIYWTPRILGILYILFVSMFALDIFDQGYNLLGIIIGLFMHLIPSYILTGILLIAWKFEKTGGALYILLGILYIIMVLGRLPFAGYATISGPAILTGILFIIAGINRGR